MGAGNCCAGRDNKQLTLKHRDQVDKTWDFLQGEAIISDIDLFDKAYAANDVEGFVNIIKSKEPIGMINQKIHPWAADPTSIGALAITQLAILAAKDDEPQFKNRIREAGALPILVSNLTSEEPDRRHASIVALSFLSVENPTNSQALYTLHAIPPLISSLRDPIEGLRGAAAQICRNIYVLGNQQRKDFKKHGGLEALVGLLKLPDATENTTSNDTDLFNQLEAIYHLEDYILDNSEEIPGMVKEVKDAGAVPLLQRLTEISNDDVKEAAQYLLARLSVS